MPVKKRIWITIAILLGIFGGIVGCTSPSPTATPSVPTITQESEPTATGPIELVNPGFEEQGADGVLAGWTSTGKPEAVMVEKNGHFSDSRLTHKASENHLVETSQVVSGLADGWYTLQAWVRSSGGQVEVYLALSCGGEEKRAYIPATTPGYRWIHLVVANQATDGQCTINLHSFGLSESWASFDDIELVPGRAELSILGADISSLKKSEDKGGVYKYADGTEADALQILKDNGMNYARLRIWVDPADGYHNKNEILEMATRLKSQGIKLLVDFHYSDDWADPGKQYKPKAWEDLDFEGLKQALYDHTFDVCNSLIAQGTPPDMVQVGNEINSGILWPDGHTWDPANWDGLAKLLTTGYEAIKACSPETRVMLHIAEGGDVEMSHWVFDNLTRRDVPFDVIGVSYYPFWHGTLAELQGNLNDISERYDKDVVVAEFAYPFTILEDDTLANIANRNMATDGYLFTPDGQRRMLRDVMSVVRGVPNGRGLGVFYWDATWTAVPGNGWDTKNPKSENAWENQALFDFNDRALPALEEYLNP
ncbi:MAG: glycosyl hydrolase 53 family protein [Anaerolineales bacterium]|nr:glycosyl hydrolase 53 family protein [Anaerolineales bacterium]